MASLAGSFRLAPVGSKSVLGSCTRSVPIKKDHPPGGATAKAHPGAGGS